MKSTYTRLFLLGYTLQIIGFANVSASSMLQSGSMPCYKNKAFVESLMTRAGNSTTYPIYDKLLHLHYHVMYLSEEPAICRILTERMEALREEFHRLFDKAHGQSAVRSIRLTDPFTDTLEIEEFDGLLSGHVVAMSGPARGPSMFSRKGIGKLKTMSVVDYVIAGDSTDMLRLLSASEIKFVESTVKFFTNLFKARSPGAHSSGPRVDFPPTPAFQGKHRGGAAASSSPTIPIPRYIPENDRLYDLLFGVVSNLLTWEDESLAGLYASVLEHFMALGPEFPSSRSSIYRSLMYVNEQLYLDRTIGLASNDPSDTVKRIGTYKRILLRLIEGEHPFVFTFEQLELIDLYESFKSSTRYVSSTDFAYKDSLKRSLLINGILFSLEFDSPSSLIVNLVLSLFEKTIEEFPSQRTSVSSEFMETLRGIKYMRSSAVIDFKRVERDALALLERISPWSTPVDIGYKHLNTEYCMGNPNPRTQHFCEVMMGLLDRQMRFEGLNWVLSSQGVMSTLQKLNKIILNRIRFCDHGTEDLINAFESAWEIIEQKLDSPAVPSLHEEKKFLERMLESPAVVVTQPTPAVTEEGWMSVSRKQKGKKGKNKKNGSK